MLDQAITIHSLSSCSASLTLTAYKCSCSILRLWSFGPSMCLRVVYSEWYLCKWLQQRLSCSEFVDNMVLACAPCFAFVVHLCLGMAVSHLVTIPDKFRDQSRPRGETRAPAGAGMTAKSSQGCYNLEYCQHRSHSIVRVAGYTGWQACCYSCEL